jgi:undecaprenyl-diphosphatase
MTYLDLVISGWVTGLTATWPVSGQMLLARLWAAPLDPDTSDLITMISGIAIGLALLVVLNKEVAHLSRGLRLSSKRRQESSVRLVLAVGMGSLPLILTDVYLIPMVSQSGWFAASVVVVQGLILWAADKIGVTVNGLYHISIPNYFVIGLIMALAQYLGLPPLLWALVATRLMGCERPQAVRLSLLLLIPHCLIGMGGIFDHLALPPLSNVVVLGGAAFAAALFGATLLLSWLGRRTLSAFAFIQIGLGALLLLGVSGLGG